LDQINLAQFSMSDAPDNTKPRDPVQPPDRGQSGDPAVKAGGKMDPPPAQSDPTPEAGLATQQRSISEVQGEGKGATGTNLDRRGLLDIKITLSNPSPTAGTQFTLNVQVTNLFDVPIWPESPQVFLPNEIITVSQGRPASESVEGQEVLLDRVSKGKIPPRSELCATRPNWFQRTFPNLSKYTPRTGSEEALVYLANEAKALYQKLSALEADRDKKKAEIDDATRGKSLSERSRLLASDNKLNQLLREHSEKNTEVEDIKEKLGLLTKQIVSLSGTSAVWSDGDLELQNFSVAGSLYVRAKGKVRLNAMKTAVVALDSSVRPGEALQPGNTAVYSLGLSTRKWLLFRPIQYNLQHSINFSFDEKRTRTHTNTASQQLTIRAPIAAVMIGAIIGGLAGYTARSLQDSSKPPLNQGMMATLASHFSLVGLILTPLLSAMAVVFLARKSDTQSMVSIEDFWGGLVIGFLVGYSGTSAFERLTNMSGAGAPGAPGLANTNSPAAN